MSLVPDFTRVGDDGPELVILHGLFGSSSNWRYLARTLGENYTVYCLDARNHGGSPWSGTMEYGAMADDVIRFMDVQGIDRTHLLGHSMGGKTAMSLALRYPGRLRRLVVADIAPRAYSHGDSHRRIIDAMKRLDLQAPGFSRKKAEEELANALGEPRPVIQFLLQNLVYADGQYRWRINLPVLDQSLQGLMDAIDIPSSARCDIPCLFLYGLESEYVQPQDRESIARIFRHSSFHGMENAGHWLHAEQPDVFARRVREFLQGQMP